MFIKYRRSNIFHCRTGLLDIMIAIRVSLETFFELFVYLNKSPSTNQFFSISFNNKQMPFTVARDEKTANLISL